MKKVKCNALSVAGLLSLAMFTGSVVANPNPGESYQGKWVKITYENKDTLPSKYSSVYAGKSFHFNSTQDVYVCRVNNRVAYLPGKLINNKCYSAYRGREVSSTEYDVLENHDLFSYRYSWVSYSGHIVNNALTGHMVIGGNEPGQTLYICRSKYYDDTVVGKYVRGHGCYLEYNGSEHLYSSNFDVLVQYNYRPQI